MQMHELKKTIASMLAFKLQFEKGLWDGAVTRSVANIQNDGRVTSAWPACYGCGLLNHPLSAPG
jgi:hypothetical protein